MFLLGLRRKLTALALCKSIESAIQWFQIHHRITFATIQNPAVYLSGARVSIFSTLVPRLMAVTTTRRRKLQNKMRKKSLIKTYGTFLEGLTHLSNKCRKKMIQESPKEVIDCVGECCINLIKGNVRLTNAQKNQLRARKQHIRLLSSKQVPLDTKKKIINQKGGALLGFLLKPLIAPIIGSVLGEIIKK